MTTAIELPDKARAIATAYWRDVPHVFSMSHPDKDFCSFCGHIEDDAGIHIEATPKPRPTVVEVIERRTSTGRSAEWLVTGSCGHEGRKQTFYDLRQRPKEKVGGPFDCWQCDSDWLDTNFPGVPSAVAERIMALIPTCPECGEHVKYLPFLTFTRHSIMFELDSSGDLNSESQHEDTLDAQPEWERHNAALLTRDIVDLADGWQTGEIAVSCENGHDWKTRELAWKREGSEDHWRVIDAS